MPFVGHPYLTQVLKSTHMLSAWLPLPHRNIPPHIYTHCDCLPASLSQKHTTAYIHTHTHCDCCQIYYFSPRTTERQQKQELLLYYKIHAYIFMSLSIRHDMTQPKQAGKLQYCHHTNTQLAFAHIYSIRFQSNHCIVSKHTKLHSLCTGKSFFCLFVIFTLSLGLLLFS